MQTTFPKLPYNPAGVVWATDHHSSAFTNAYPRSDLEHLEDWDEFPTEIDDVVVTRMGAQRISPGVAYNVDVPLPRKPRIVWNEEGVRGQAAAQLHDVVEGVLAILGYQGNFRPSSSGNVHIIGEPDFCWISHDNLHPKLVIEYKTLWAAPLEKLRETFSKDQNVRNTLEKQSVDGLYQVYGYMTLNENKYGILTNLQHFWFFQRVETGDNRGKTLKCFGPMNLNSDGPNILKAFVGIILLSENSWFPTPCPSPPSRYFVSSVLSSTLRDAAIARAQHYRSPIIGGTYQVLELNSRLCCFDRTSVRHSSQRGFTARATLIRKAITGENVFCKIVDLCQRRNPIQDLDREVRNYATLRDLQGVAIPHVRGYYNVWRLLRLLVLQDVGKAILEDGQIDNQMRQKMKDALSLIHREGFIHGDISRRNFCKEGNKVFLVDLETLAVGSDPQFNVEMQEIDAL